MTLDMAAWVRRTRTFLRGLSRLPGKVEVNDSIEAPGNEGDHREWLESMQCSLPDEIRRFVGEASNRCCFSYRWEPSAPWRERLERLFPGRAYFGGGGDLCEGSVYSVYDHRDRHAHLYQEGLMDFADLVKNSMMDLPMADRFLEMLKNPSFPQQMLELTGMSAVLAPRGGFLRLLPLGKEHELALELAADDGICGVVHRSLAGNGIPHRLSTDFEEFLLAWEMTCYQIPDPKELVDWLDPQTGLLQPDPGKARALRSLLSDAARENQSPSN